MRLQSLLLLAFTARAAAAVEREDQHRDFDELRLETQLGDDVPLDPESQERLVRIARQMGAIITTEPSVHVTHTLPKPSIVTGDADPEDWEFVTPITEDRAPDQRAQERIREPGPRRINLLSSARIERRIGKLLPDDDLPEEETSAENKFIGGYLATIKNRIGSLRAMDIPKAEFRSTASHSESEDSSTTQIRRAERREDGDPLRERLWTIPSKKTKQPQKSQEMKLERKPLRKRKPLQGSSALKPSQVVLTSTTTPAIITSSPPSKTSDEHAPTRAPTLLGNVDVDEASLDSQDTSDMEKLPPLEISVDKNESSPNNEPSFSGLSASDDVDNLMAMDEKTRHILQQLAALNLYQELPMEVEADEDDGRLPLDGDTSHRAEDNIVDQHRAVGPVGNHRHEANRGQQKGVNSTAQYQQSEEPSESIELLDLQSQMATSTLDTDSNSTVASEEAASSGDNVPMDDDLLQQQTLTPDRMQLQHVDSADTAASDAFASSHSARSPKNLSSSNDSTTLNGNGVTSQIVYHRELKRRPTKRVSTTRRPVKSGSSKRTSSSTSTRTIATSTTTTTTTPAPTTSDDILDDTLEEFDSDEQSQLAADGPDLTTEPSTSSSTTTPTPATTTTMVTVRQKSKKKASQAVSSKYVTNEGGNSGTASASGSGKTYQRHQKQQPQQQKTESMIRVPSSNGSGGGGGAATSDGAQSKGHQGSAPKSDQVTMLPAATYQVPQVILPPPQLPVNPLAALGNLLPLLQMLNRPATPFYQPLSHAAAASAGGGIKNGASKLPQQVQNVHQVAVKPVQYQQVPYYSMPQYGMSSPYYFPQMYMNQQQLANVSTTVRPTPPVVKSPSRPLAQKPVHTVKPAKKKQPQRKPSPQKPTAPLGGAGQQLPNIATTIRTMMHLLNANNLMFGNNANTNNKKKHRMPKFIDTDDSSPHEREDLTPPLQTDDTSDEQANQSHTRWQKDTQQEEHEQQQQQQLFFDNSTRDSSSMDSVARDVFVDDSVLAMTDAENRSNVAKAATAPTATTIATEPSLSSELVHRDDDEDSMLLVDSLPFGFPQLSDEVNSGFPMGPPMERRMDIHAVDEDNDASDLGRALGTESNYKMLMGLLTGAFGRRRDSRSLAKQTQNQVDIEKSRQVANNMIMRSLLYNPPPMYQRLPTRVAWPMVQQASPPQPRPSTTSSSSPSFQRLPANLASNFLAGTGSRPTFYGKHLVHRPRQPRYYIIGGVPREVHDISRFNERGFESVEDAFDTTFPSIPIERTFHATEQQPTLLPTSQPAKYAAKNDDMLLKNSSHANVFKISTQLSLPPDGSVRQQLLPAVQGHHPKVEQNFTTEMPSYVSTSLPAGVRIVIPTSTSTTPAPLPVIKFSNRIGDSRTKRSIINKAGSLGRHPKSEYRSKIDLSVVQVGSVDGQKDNANKLQAPFFEFVGEVRQGGSNSSTALGRNSISPEESFLQVNDWNTLFYPLTLKADPAESHSRTGPIAMPHPDRRRRTARSVETTGITDPGRCFYANTTFSTMLNCNDEYYSCNSTHPNSEACSCNDDCVLFGDCCWDKVSELQKEFGSLADIEYSRDRLKQLSCIKSNENMSYYMISKCDPSWRSYPESELCSGANPDDDLLRVPVTSRKTLNTYKNVVCAHCHDDVADLIFWEVDFHCPKQLQISSIHRAIGGCPFATNPPDSLTREQRQLAARTCNPYVDYETSTDLECEHISANDSATIRAPSRHVADKLSVMCDLIHLPTIDVDFPSCDRLFYRNRFCALCRQRLVDDLRCPVDAEMPMPLEYNGLPIEDATRFHMNLRWQNSDVLCNKADHMFDPWRKGCRRIFHGKLLSHCDHQGIDPRANSPMSYFIVKESWLSYVSIGCLILTVVSLYYFGYIDNKFQPHDSGSSPLDDIILCLISSLLGAQLLFHVSITKNSCPARFICMWLGIAFHFCSVSCLAWTNVLLHKVWTHLKYAVENNGKRASTFFTGYCVYAWALPAVTVGVATFANFILDPNDEISPCYGCQGICFISNLPAFWLFLGGPLIYVVAINIFRFAKVLQECRGQTEEAMCRCIVRLPLRSVISAILLATLIPLTWAVALAAVSLENERAWLVFLFCYACHGPLCLLLSGAALRYLRPLKRLLAFLTSGHKTMHYRSYLPSRSGSHARQYQRDRFRANM